MRLRGSGLMLVLALMLLGGTEMIVFLERVVDEAGKACLVVGAD